MQKNSNKIPKSFWIIIFVALIVFLAASVLIIYSGHLEKSRLKIDEQSDTTPIKNEIKNERKLKTYQDEIIQFEHPANWRQIKSLSPGFSDYFTVLNEDCRPLILQDMNETDMLLIVNQHEGLQIDYIDSCWVGDSHYSREPRWITLENGEEISILFDVFSSDKEYYVHEWHGFQSDFIESDSYYVSIIYPRRLEDTAQPLYNEILSSFSFVRQYKAMAPSEWKVYKSPMLGYSFEYPADWGGVTEEIADAQDIGAGDSGKIYSLSFTKKSSLQFPREAYGAGQSMDFSAGRGMLFADYAGDLSKPASVTSEITTNLAYQCYEVPVQQYPYRGVIFFNLPGKKISGVMLVVPILSPSDREKFNDIVAEFISTEEECEEGSGTLQFSDSVILKEKEILSMLEGGINFDEESKVNLDIFTRMRESARILE